MQSNPSVAPVTAFASALKSGRLAGWTREPLLHFMVLGGLLFAVDHWLIGRTDDPHTIVVDAAVDRDAVEIFRAARGRAPDQTELAALRRAWLDNEVLYREGLAMRVDAGDTAIRERVIFKALSVVDANVKLPQPTEAQLREWFEAHRVKYDQPARYDFQEAMLAGDTSESAVRGFVKDLNNGTPGDARAGLRVFTNRPLDNLVQSYGAEFPAELAAAPPGEWRALSTRDGWRAIRLTARSPALIADYENLRNIVLQDWKDATASAQRSAAVQEMARKYTIKYQTAAK